jgi:hypothetical protein
MKLKSIFLIASLVIVSAFQVNAQSSNNESKVKILRTPTPGIVKLIYGMEANEAVKITFKTQDGEVGADRISGTFPKGFMKKYDIRKINKEEFWVEVSSKSATFIYHVVPTHDNKVYATRLEKSVYHDELVALK